MLVSLFDYDLPADLIAQSARPRGSTRLLHLDRESGRIEAHPFSGFPGFLRAGDLLVINDTKVLPARLFGKRTSDERSFEFLLTRPAANRPDEWESLVKPGRRTRPGDRFEFGAGLRAILLSKERGACRLAFEGRPVLEALDEVGVVPLPPYIRRTAGPSTSEDFSAYQTVYARVPGAVAAPTAGLHFTEEILAQIARGGVRVATVTLAVGPGTFKPVKASDTGDHVIDAEHYDVSLETARAYAETRAAGGRICAVGTTTVRTLESVVADDGSSLRPGQGDSNLFITPGHHFRAVDALLTNFHLPKSTLLMLASAFATREKILESYEFAKSRSFLFYSYGDAMWIS